MKGRIRMIKPELGKHWLLWHLGEVTGWPQLFGWYALLWCWTDRRERFEWSPMRLKSEIAPYVPVNFEHVLNALANAGFIVKYRAGVRCYGWIPRFLAHQSPNGREDDSVLPPPPSAALTHYNELHDAGGFDMLTLEQLIAAPVCVEGSNPSMESDLGTRASRVSHAHSITSHSIRSGEVEGIEQPGQDNETNANANAITTRAPRVPAGKASDVLQRLAVVFGEIAGEQREKLTANEVREHQAEMVFLYWSALFEHPKAIIVARDKRIAKILARLKENDGDVSELLYALDGAHKDKWIMGLDPRSEGKKYDDIVTVLRDRQQVEKFAGASKKYRDGVPHKLIPRLEAALRGDGAINTEETTP